MGYGFLLFFIFASTSRILDYSLYYLRIPLITSILAAALIFMGGGLRTAFETRIAKFMGLFAAWFVICMPFSQWRGGSFAIFTETFSKSFLLFVMVAGAITGVARLRRLILVIVAGTVAAMIIANAMQARVDGRLTMTSGQFTNPNDLAQFMLVGMFLLPVWIVRGGGRLTKVMIYALMLPFLYTVFDTGSRAALLSLLALAAIIFLAAKPQYKIGIAVLFLVMGAGLFALSDSARIRLGTMFSDEAAEEGTTEEIAASSQRGRIQTLKQSVILTAQNPLFGVGPGIFSAAAAEVSHESGRRAAWVETHNAYTQVSSELGIPGLIFFLGAVGGCIKGLLRVRKKAAESPQFKEIHGTATCLLLAFLAFAFTSFFSSVAYQLYFSMLIGMCASGIAVMERELSTAATPRSVPPGYASAPPSNPIRG
jgi:O-antigen ligase